MPDVQQNGILSSVAQPLPLTWEKAHRFERTPQEQFEDLIAFVECNLVMV